VELLSCPDDVPTLENFAYGDTPTDGALRGLVGELFSLPVEFDVSLYELSGRFDLRPLVLRTALTYLELYGLLRQGTPYYAGYKIKPLLPVRDIAAKFQGERARFVSDIFSCAKQGRTWYSLDAAAAAVSLRADRSRIIRALDYLQDQGWMELQAGDVRQRYTRLCNPDSLEDLTRKLTLRFQSREEQEIRRVAQVLGLITHPGCQTNALVAYFGEIRPQPCGHCGFCLTGRPQELPESRTPERIPARLDIHAFCELRSANRGALGDSRQAARFLCGLSSPALTKARLSRHEFFGIFEEYRFADVLVWCSNASEIGQQAVATTRSCRTGCEP
jgi:ATP-dependent DNA helicase RecQ